MRRSTHRRLSQSAILEQKIGPVKALVNEEVVAQDGLQSIVTRGSAPSIASLEESLKEAKSIYEDKCGFSLSEEIVIKMVSTSLLPVEELHQCQCLSRAWTW